MTKKIDIYVCIFVNSIHLRPIVTVSHTFKVQNDRSLQKLT